MADLITRDALRTLLGVDPTDTRDDSRYDVLIPAASAAIRSFTERDFGSSSVTEDRTYTYDGSGFLDIDDAAEITAVAFIVPNSADFVLDTDQWRAMPTRRDDAPVYTYISIYSSVYAGSPEMGFTRNVDVLAREGGLQGVWTPLVRVTGTWGWPEVPLDVQLATAWTIQDWMNTADAEGLTSESIEGFSRSWGGGQVAMGGAPVAIPNRARDILAAYQKLDV